MNSKSKTIISIILPLLCLVVIIMVYYMRQSGSIKNQTSDYKLSAKALNKEFIMNDSASNAKYGNKIIELTGSVADIKNSEMHGIIITLDNPMMGVKCVMDSTIKTLPTDIAVGDTVNIKGVCIGSDQLIGVMMNQCFITEKKAP